MKIQFPLTIHNGTGEKITFTGITVRNGVEFLEVENEVQPNVGPPMHVHYLQDESLTVLSGKMGYQILGEEKKYAEPGKPLIFRAGVPHKFWNAGTDILLCRGYISPAGNAAYFLDRLFESSRENGGRPGIFDAAFLLDRYRSEFVLLEIPRFVQNVFFPIILMLGKMTGRYKKFADAPPAMPKQQLATT